ncbi:MAG: ATP-binding protein [Acidobacteriales bacterium]|nr:ATP-binding protein [Terriglobales bacterium]
MGRERELSRVTRALSQVSAGKPQYVFITGEYGIGKSSLAGFVKFVGEREHALLGVHVFLGGAETLEEVATKTVEAILKSGAYDPSIGESVRNALAKYVGSQSLFGFNVNLEALKADAPNLSRGYLPLLNGLFERAKEDGRHGLLLVLDEINGITANPRFAHFIKGLVDENALSRRPLPLLLVLCGVEERRREMIRHHRPVERIFDIVEIEPMNESEVRAFFQQAFAAEDLTIEEEALRTLMHYSAGYPKLMHILGDYAFWIDRDGKIANDDALLAVYEAADDVGKKFVDQQVLKALRSQDYRSILAKLGKQEFDLDFRVSEISNGLTTSERKKLNNFLQKMKRLNVLRAGEQKGTYIFTSRLVRLYILLNSAEISK